MANPSSPNGEHTGTATETAHRDMDAAKETAREDLDEIKHRATDDFDAVKREARAEFDHVRHEAGSYAEGQKNQAADQIAGIASAFGRVGDELRSGEQSWAGTYAGDLAHRLENVADRARNSSVNEMVGDVEQFGRERPTAFIATAALLGFAASRFLTASAHRRHRPDDSYTGRTRAGAPRFTGRDDGSRGSGPVAGLHDGSNTGGQS